MHTLSFPFAPGSAGLTLFSLWALPAVALGAEQDLETAATLDVKVTVSAAGQVTAAPGEVENGKVHRAVTYGLPCTDGIDASSFRVMQAVGDATATDVFALSKGAAHFKGMKKYVWSLTVPVAEVAALAAACASPGEPTARAVFEVKYTCSGAKQAKFFTNLSYPLTCAKAPAAPADAPPAAAEPPPPPREPGAPGSTTPPPGATLCRTNADCPRGLQCVRGGYCSR
jgi:hypothetical protein